MTMTGRGAMEVQRREAIAKVVILWSVISEFTVLFLRESNVNKKLYILLRPLMSDFLFMLLVFSSYLTLGPPCSASSPVQLGCWYILSFVLYALELCLLFGILGGNPFCSSALPTWCCSLSTFWGFLLHSCRRSC